MLRCNSYEVIDLGVMVPCDKVLRTAVDEGADLVGLSGLITPSLDEMVFVAKEMAGRGMTQPLLIGGATTSRRHTAVKIAPEYPRPTVHVADASRVVDVVASLLSPERKEAFDDANRRDQATLREQFAARAGRPLRAYAEAAANGLRTAWRDADVPAPSFTGRRAVEVQLEELTPYIDWTFFFAAWELKGRFPAILDDPRHGPAARELHADATELLRQIVDAGGLTARGVYGFWPAAGDGDDVVVRAPGADGAGADGAGADGADAGGAAAGGQSAAELVRFHMLRQQEALDGGRPNLSLADYVAPAGSGVADHVGAFAVTAGIGAGDLVGRFERDGDDYRAIMVKALADRLAEAFAEYLHARVRRDWGYERAGAAVARGSHRGPLPRHPAPPSATPPVRTTARSSRCSTCSTPRPPASR